MSRRFEALGDLDFLIVPTLPFVAPEVGATWNEPVRTRMTHFTRAFNDTGWPALALPCGPAEDGLPASLQLVGRPGDDARVLAAGTQSVRRDEVRRAPTSAQKAASRMNDSLP